MSNEEAPGGAVSARQRLIDTLNEEHNQSYWGDDSRDAEALVNAFAHELAEEIRNHGDTGTAWGEPYCNCADLIDPEVRDAE